MKRLGFFRKTSVFFRSFLIQGSWNFAKMQNLGMVFAMAPVLRRYASTQEKQQEAIQHYLEFFNTHPYMASSLIGTLSKMEEEASQQERYPLEIHSLKERLMGAYGAVGDAFFWSTIKPMFILFGLLAALGGNLIAPLVFLVLFNIVHLVMRWYLFAQGYGRGVHCVDLIHHADLPNLAAKLRYLSLFLLAVCLFQTEKWVGITPAGWWEAALLVGMICFVGVVYFLLKKGLEISVIISIVVSLVLAAQFFV